MSDNPKVKPDDDTPEEKPPEAPVEKPAVPAKPEENPATPEEAVADRVARLEFQTAKKEALDSAERTYEGKVPRDILAFANSEEDIKEIADKYIANIKIERNKALEEKGKEADIPRLTGEQVAEQTKSLTGSGRVTDYLSLKARQADIALN